MSYFKFRFAWAQLPATLQFFFLPFNYGPFTLIVTERKHYINQGSGGIALELGLRRGRSRGPTAFRTGDRTKNEKKKIKNPNTIAKLLKDDFCLLCSQDNNL